MNGASTAEIEDRQFTELLERAPRDAEGFSAAIGPWLDRSLERFFPALLTAIDHAPAEIGPLAAELVRSRYRAKAPDLLIPLLGQGVPLRFNWAAGILVDLRVDAVVSPLCRILERHEKNLLDRRDSRIVRTTPTKFSCRRPSATWCRWWTGLDLLLWINCPP